MTDELMMAPTAEAESLPPIEIDLSELEWGDIERLEALGQDPEAAKALTGQDLLDLMRRLCPSGYKRLKVRRDTQRFFEALGRALAEGGDPNS